MNEWLGSKRLLLAAVCALGAGALLIGALLEQGDPANGKWVPMNEAMELMLANNGGRSGDINKSGGHTSGTEGHSGHAGADIAEEVEAGPDETNLPDSEGDSVMSGGSGGTGGTGGTDGTDGQGASEEIRSEVDEIANESIGKIDINRASAEQLDGLKGIGPAKAQAIVADREKNGKFGSVDELLRVKGIGEKLLSSMKESVVALP